MESIRSNTALNVLDRANAGLEHFFARFSGAAVMGTSDEVESLLQVEQILRSVRAVLDQARDNPDIQDELAKYRVNLLRLRKELAIMQDSATASRAKLFVRQKHLHAAQAWCDTSRVTQ